MSREQKSHASKSSNRVCIPNIKYNPIAFKIIKNEIEIMKPPAKPVGSPFDEPIVLPNFSSSSIKSLLIKRKRDISSTIDKEDENEDENEDEEEEEVVKHKKQKVNHKSIDKTQKIKEDKFLDFINLFETSEFNQLLIDVGFPKSKEITQNSVHTFLTFAGSN